MQEIDTYLIFRVLCAMLIYLGFKINERQMQKVHLNSMHPH